MKAIMPITKELISHVIELSKKAGRSIMEVYSTDFNISLCSALTINPPTVPHPNPRTDMVRSVDPKFLNSILLSTFYLKLLL